MGMKLELASQGKNINLRCLRAWCCGEYLDVNGANMWFEKIS
jgi:hypothetical protein